MAGYRRLESFIVGEDIGVLFKPEHDVIGATCSEAAVRVDLLYFVSVVVNYF